MGLLDIVRSGVAIANQLTNDLQAVVQHQTALSLPSGSGTVALANAVARQALVEKKQKVIRTASGELVLSQASVTFLDPSVVVTLFDKIVLPDGSTGPILALEGFVDRVSGNPILTQVYLG